MTRTLLVTALVLAPTLAAAGPVERACMSADRPAATRSLCSCVQSAASATLTRSEQRKAAKMFRDPHRAQEIKMSDASANERFWDRYKRFAATARRSCS